MTSAADAHFPFDVAFDILQRVLDDESRVLEQLSYLVGHLHDPIFDGCGRLSMAAVQPQRGPGNCLANSSASKPVAVLTFAQYWEMFANIATLHGAQSTIVQKLEEVVSYKSHILEQGQQKHHQSQPKVARKTSLEFSSDRGSSGGLQGPQSIVELFCSAAMRHYIAEHMMYSLNYSRNIAPRVMELWRLWRCLCEKQTYAQLSAVERKEMASYTRFLRFLWDAFGNEAGVPNDPRVIFTRLPETTPATAPRQGGLNTTSTGAATNVNSSTGSSSSKRTTATHAALQEAPPIPPYWRGFETLLVLLATPLASLRRYMHVARCIIESQCLPAAVRQRLQTEFIDVVALRVAEEQKLVFDEVTRQDVTHIMSLIDEVDPPLSETDPTKITRIHPDEDGSRTLVHYGRLVKRFRRGRHERLVFLFSDWLCYVEEQANGRMRLRASISLESLLVVDLDDTAEVVNGFDIVTKERRITFFAPTLEQKLRWVEALRNTSEAHNVKLQQLAASQRRSGLRQQQQPQHTTRDGTHPTRVTALCLSQNSRLRRQQRADRAQQQRQQLKQRTTAELAATTTTTEVSAADVFSAPPTAESKFEQRPRSASARSLHGGFDVSYWAQQSTDTVHRRVRSSHLLPTFWLSLSPPPTNTAEAEAVASAVDSSSGKDKESPDNAAVVSSSSTWF